MPANITGTTATGAGAATAPLRTYGVKSGDTLSGIAKKLLGDVNRWREIHELNKAILPNPNLLSVGMVLQIPNAPSGSPATQPAGGGTAPTGGSYGTIGLTFDDGPHAVNTPKVLDTLKARGVKATFFVTGANAKRYPALIRRIVQEGHSLGNHTWSHPDLTDLTEKQIASELSRTQDAVDAALGYPYPLKLVRPPYGASNSTVRKAVGTARRLVFWEVDSNDWRHPNNPEKIVANVFEGSHSVYKHKNGGIVLFHDVKPQTAAILGMIVGRLADEQFTLKRPDELLGLPAARVPAPVS